MKYCVPTNSKHSFMKNKLKTISEATRKIIIIFVDFAIEYRMMCDINFFYIFSQKDEEKTKNNSKINFMVS